MKWEQWSRAKTQREKAREREWKVRKAKEEETVWMAHTGEKLAREKKGEGEERFCGDEGRFEKRVEDENNDDLKIKMEK